MPRKQARCMVYSRTHGDHPMPIPYIFTQPLTVPLPGPRRRYQVVQCWSYEWIHGGRRYKAVVDDGFEFDGLSCPRWLWTVTGITPDGLGRAAAVIHDLLYECKGVWPTGSLYRWEPMIGCWQEHRATWTREDCDRMLGRLMRDAQVEQAIRRRAYWGVRIFGWWRWRRNKR